VAIHARGSDVALFVRVPLVFFIRRFLGRMFEMSRLQAKKQRAAAWGRRRGSGRGTTGKGVRSRGVQCVHLSSLRRSVSFSCDAARGLWTHCTALQLHSSGQQQKRRGGESRAAREEERAKQTGRDARDGEGGPAALFVDSRAPFCGQSRGSKAAIGAVRLTACPASVSVTSHCSSAPRIHTHRLCRAVCPSATAAPTALPSYFHLSFLSFLPVLPFVRSVSMSDLWLEGDPALAPASMGLALESFLGEQLGPRRKLYLANGSSWVCKFFNKGTCMRGTDCPYRHSRGDKPYVCKFWLRGLSVRHALTPHC